MLIDNALLAAATAKNDNLADIRTRYPVGSHVQVAWGSDSYAGEQGTVIGHSASMLGLPLIDVRIGRSKPCFYSHELMLRV